MSVVKTPGFCALCKSRCGSVMVTEHGKLIGQEPNPEHPTGVALCVKGRAAPEIVYRPERELYPLVRTRPKGDPDPGWKRVTWDEALDRVASELARIRGESGAEAVAFGVTTPSGTPIADNITWINRFTRAFGSPNVAAGMEVCNWHKDYAQTFTFGRSVASPDFEKTQCMVLWGHNPSATWLDHATATAAAVARGAKLVVVDPRRAGFASRADQWLRVRPGSDGALALGIAREMLRNGWFDADFVKRWSNGPMLVRMDTMRFLRSDDMHQPKIANGHILARSSTGDLVEYDLVGKRYVDTVDLDLFAVMEVELADGTRVVCKSALALHRELCDQYPPERVAELCWVEKEQIAQTARILHESGPVCYFLWTGTGQHTNATQTDRAISILMALTGGFDAPGGNVEFSKPKSNDASGAEFLKPEQRAKCIEYAHSPLGQGRQASISAASLYTAILEKAPYEVRGLVDFGRNFVVSHGNSHRGAQALKSLEFFVHMDVVMSPTAQFADVFLPVNTPWEREALRVGFEGSQAAESLVQLRAAAIDSLGESKSDAYVVFELAKRLGLGHLFWDGDIEAGMNYILEPLGITASDLRKRPNGIPFEAPTDYYRYLKTGFKTPTGRIEIFSEAFRDAGHPPLPSFVEPALSPMRPGAHDFPLVLTSAKVVQFCHSQHRDIPSLRKRSPEPELYLHPDAAGERGIARGDMVELRTHMGSVRMRASLDAHLDPRVVVAQYGWWAGNQTLGLPALDALAAEGGNVNRLISDDTTDPISGSVGHRSYLCDVQPIETVSTRAWSGWRPFRIAKTIREAEGILSFVLCPVDGQALAPFAAGQHVNVRVSTGGGNVMVRCYSLSGACDSASYRISVKYALGGEGRVSKTLHGLEPGARVDLQAPKGSFRIPDALLGEGTPRPIVLVAAGIGITPMLSMLYQLRDARWAGPVQLLYGVRGAKDHAFKAEVAELAATVRGLRTTTFYSQPTDADIREGGFDSVGRITGEDLLGFGKEAVFFLCGPAAMVEAASSALHAAGVPEDQVLLEAFGPSSRQRQLPHRGPQTVELTRSGTSFTWTPGAGSLLDQLERTGAPFASGCRTGQCESCRVELAGGTVSHPDGCAPVDGGHCLPCVAVPLSRITLQA